MRSPLLSRTVHGDPFGPPREGVPLGRRQAISIANASRPDRAIRHARVVVGEDEQRLAGRPGLRAVAQPIGVRQQARHANGARDARVEHLGPGQRHRDECGDQRQAMPIDLGIQGGRGRGQEAPVAELGAGIAGGRHLVEYLRGGRRLVVGCEFERTPGTGCVGDADHR